MVRNLYCAAKNSVIIASKTLLSSSTLKSSMNGWKTAFSKTNDKSFSSVFKTLDNSILSKYPLVPAKTTTFAAQQYTDYTVFVLKAR